MITFKVYMLDGQVIKLDGNNIADAFIRNNLTTNLMGNIDFFFPIPIPVEEKKEIHEYQLYLMNTKKDNWREERKPTNNFATLEGILYQEVKRNGNFSGMIVDLLTEKPVSWIWR